MRFQLIAERLGDAAPAPLEEDDGDDDPGVRRFRNLDLD
jgi:hypothetical protein